MIPLILDLQGYSVRICRYSPRCGLLLLTARAVGTRKMDNADSWLRLYLLGITLEI